MTPVMLSLIELVVFFISVGVIFQALEAFDLARFFKKGYVWQIQILYITFTIIIAFLFTQAFVNLLDIMNKITSAI